MNVHDKILTYFLNILKILCDDLIFPKQSLTFYFACSLVYSIILMCPPPPLFRNHGYANALMRGDDNPQPLGYRGGGVLPEGNESSNLPLNLHVDIIHKIRTSEDNAQKRLYYTHDSYKRNLPELFAAGHRWRQIFDLTPLSTGQKFTSAPLVSTLDPIKLTCICATRVPKYRTSLSRLLMHEWSIFDL